MSIIRDLNATIKQHYVDEANWKCGTNDTIVKLSSSYNNAKNILVDIIGNSLHLSASAIELYRVMSNNYKYNNEDNKIEIIATIKSAVNINKKSEITYKRAIEELISKGVIKYNTNKKYVEVNNIYNINDINDIDKKEYIIIEVNRD